MISQIHGVINKCAINNRKKIFLIEFTHGQSLTHLHLQHSYHRRPYCTVIRQTQYYNYSRFYTILFPRCNLKPCKRVLFHIVHNLKEKNKGQTLYAYRKLALMQANFRLNWLNPITQCRALHRVQKALLSQHTQREPIEGARCGLDTSPWFKTAHRSFIVLVKKRVRSAGGAGAVLCCSIVCVVCCGQHLSGTPSVDVKVEFSDGF